MPSAGLSLVGFMEQENAVRYLGNTCVPDDSSEAALLEQWNAARAQLGDPFPDAGQAIVADIPDEHAAHVQAVAALPWVAPELKAGWELKQVEIDPLLAFQFHVDLARSDSRCARLPESAALADSLPVCLSLDWPAPPILAAMDGDHSVVIKSPSSDLRVMRGGQHPQQPLVFGVILGCSLPAVRVVRCADKCYLVNGFHRTVGVRRRGLEHVPCLFREVADFGEVGARGGNETFERDLLESKNPPTLGHFASGRAYAVKLRRGARIINVSWSSYFLPEE